MRDTNVRPMARGGVRTGDGVKSLNYVYSPKQEESHLLSCFGRTSHPPSSSIPSRLTTGRSGRGPESRGIIPRSSRRWCPEDGRLRQNWEPKERVEGLVGVRWKKRLYLKGDVSKRPFLGKYTDQEHESCVLCTQSTVEAPRRVGDQSADPLPRSGTRTESKDHPCFSPDPTPTLSRTHPSSPRCAPESQFRGRCRRGWTSPPGSQCAHDQTRKNHFVPFTSLASEVSGGNRLTSVSHVNITSLLPVVCKVKGVVSPLLLWTFSVVYILSLPLWLIKFFRWSFSEHLCSVTCLVLLSIRFFLTYLWVLMKSSIPLFNK